MRISDIWASLARAVRWHRRPLAAAAAACAVLTALSALSPAPAPTVAVVVAADDLPAGATLAETDLRVARYPDGITPARALTSPADAVGKVLSAPVAEGSPITSMSTVSTELTPKAGELLVPFHVSDPAVLSLVQVGDRVTVVGAGDGGSPVTLASRVRVAALPHGAGSSGGALGGGSEASSGLVVVAVDQTTAAKLAGWSSSDGLGIALG